MPRRLSLVLCLLLPLSAALPASASLIPTIENETTGTGLGAVNTVLTLQNDPTESGCVAYDGTGTVDGPAACPPGSTIVGGDETAITESRTLAEVGITSAFNLRVVFNYNEDNTDNITLEDLILTIYDPAGNLLFNSEPFDPVVFTEPFNGTGTSGFVFRLDTQQATAAQPFFADPNNRLGLAADLSGTSGGPETFYIGDATALTPAAADLSLVKTDSTDPATVGTPFTYTLTTENLGPNNAQNVTVADTLPASVTFDSATASQGSCTLDGRVVLCDLATLNSGATATVDITVTPTAEGTVTNTASVSSDTADPDTSNNSDTEQTVVDSGMTAPSADLSITKIDSVDPATVGMEFTYTLTVANAGPDTATDVTVTDNLPATVTVGAVTPSQGSCSTAGQTVTCDLGPLASGASATIDIAVTPTTDDATLTNTASVTATEADPDPSDNVASESTEVGGGSGETTEISVSKNGPSPVAVGQEFTYTVNIFTGDDDFNDGTLTAQLTDVLPATFDVVDIQPSQGNCTQAGQVITCDIGSLVVSDVAFVFITVVATEPGTFVNTATVSTDEVDPNPGNNTDTATTVVVESADLSITKTDSPDPVAVGANLTYTLTIDNDGPTAATGVTVTDVLPSSVTLASAMPSQGLCTDSGRVVTCDLGTLDAGDAATVTIQVTPNQAGQITNNASVSGDQPDPDDTDNTATEDTTVGTGGAAAADLRVVKTADPGAVEVGDTVTFEIDVFNDGPDDATDVSVVDTLPADFTFDGAMASSGLCNLVTPSTVVCELGNLDAGAMETVTVTAVADAQGTASNTATVSGDELDPEPTDNTDTAVVAVGTPVVIPTLGEMALVLLSLLTALAGVTVLRRV